MTAKGSGRGAESSWSMWVSFDPARQPRMASPLSRLGRRGRRRGLLVRRRHAQRHEASERHHRQAKDQRVCPRTAVIVPVRILDCSSAGWSAHQCPRGDNVWLNTDSPLMSRKSTVRLRLCASMFTSPKNCRPL